jgi:hypothetical protein
MLARVALHRRAPNDALEEGLWPVERKRQRSQWIKEEMCLCHNSSSEGSSMGRCYFFM